MSGNHWWDDYGSFRPWKICPTRPDPGEVVQFYLNKRGIETEKQITYLIDLLDLQKSMVYNILKGEGLDAISRCRRLAAALKIPPPLLGLDAKYNPIEQHAYWWRSCGFSFNADAQGYPLMSEVIVYLRSQRTLTGEGGKVKAWSQEDLGEAAGLKKETIYRMEHDRNPLILESISRRAIVASALGTLAGDMEATIFRLFGIDPQAHGVRVPAHESVPAVYLPTRKLTDEMLKRYQQQQSAFFTQYYTHHGQDTIGEVREWTKQLLVLLAEANTTAQRVSLLALQSRNHRLLACLAREQCQKGRILFHTRKAVEWAEQAMTLPNPKLREDHALLVATNELLASALFTTAMASYELGQYGLALEYVDRMLNVFPTVQSRQLKIELLGVAALARAHTAKISMDQQTALSYIHRAASLNTPSQPVIDAPDDNFFQCGNSMLSIHKARMLSSPKMKGATHEKIFDILEDAQRLTPNALLRRQVCIEFLQAQALFEAGKYEQATEFALSALEKSREIRSRLWKNCIEGLYKKLLSTSFRDKPLLAYLGMKLRTWAHGMG